MQGFGRIARAGAALALAIGIGAPSLASAQTTVNGGLVLLSPTPIGATGGGLGSVATILTLQSPGSATTETGCISPTGTASCGFANASVQQGQSQTQFIAGLTGSTLRLGYNATEPNNDLSTTLNSLVLTLYRGTTAEASFTLGAPLTLTNTLNGVGNFGFEFGLSSQAQTVFNSVLAMGTANLSLGVGASVSNATGGVETFNLAAGPAQGGGAGSVVPEPSTYILLATGMGALGLVARRRRTNV